MNIYYVYAYIRQNDNTPYYIGKGCKNRAYWKHSNVTTPKDKSKIIFLETNLTELGAFALERRYIRWYGRKGIDPNGILRNISEGGDMPPSRKGITHSEEARKRIGIASKNRKRNPQTEEAKMRISVSKKGTVPTPETLAKLSIAQKNRWKTKPRPPFSEETKAKMSASAKNRRKPSI